MEIRIIKDGEEEKCNNFHNRLYKTNRTLKQWQWVFLKNDYEPDKPLYTVAVDNDNIVGTQTFIPIKMIDEKGIFWTAKSEGTLVDPAFRGKQIFKKMYDLFFEYAEENRFAYIWGFTTATKALIRINFKTPLRTTQIFLPFSARAVSMLGNPESNSLKTNIYKIGLGLARIFSSIKIIINKPNLNDSIQIKTVDKAPLEVGDICKRFIETYGGKTIYRDAEYFQWRIFENPYAKGIFKTISVDGKLVGWVIYSLGDDGVGCLVDILVVPDKNNKYSIEYLLKRLIYEAVIGTRDMGATGIRGWHVTNHPFDLLIKKVAQSMGFIHFNKGYASVIYSTQSATERPSHDLFQDWYISRIYTEGVLG